MDAENTNEETNTEGTGDGNEQPTPKQPTPESSKSDLFGPSDDDLQKELHKYAKALREEFQRSDGTSVHPDDRAAENVEKYTRDFFKKNLASACAQIVWLSANSTSDSVRLNACKTIVHEALADARASGDPIKEILLSLGSNTGDTEDTQPHKREEPLPFPTFE